MFNLLRQRLAKIVISALCVCALMLVIPEAVPSQGTRQPDPKEEIFVIGPYSLGDCYQDCKGGKALGDVFGKGVGPTEVAIIKSLNDCKIHVIEKRVLKGKEWGFSKTSNYPKLVAEGPMMFEFKDAQGKPFTIQLVTLEMQGVYTDYSVSPPQRCFLVVAKLKVDGYAGPIAGYARYTIMRNEPVAYEVNGKKHRKE